VLIHDDHQAKHPGAPACPDAGAERCRNRAHEGFNAEVNQLILGEVPGLHAKEPLSQHTKHFTSVQRRMKSDQFIFLELARSPAGPRGGRWWIGSAIGVIAK